MTNFNFETYLSPFTWRYGSPEMRQIWSEHNKRLLWRTIWLKLAAVQSEFGLVDPIQLADIESHYRQVDIERSLQIEASLHHDLMAELQTFTEQCPLGGKILHTGATSMDIEDNADVLRIRQSLILVSLKIKTLLDEFAQKIMAWADLPVIAFTHLQPAEPTTLGYRMAVYAQDFLDSARSIQAAITAIKGKGFKGAVGTSASFSDLLGYENLPVFEEKLSGQLDLNFFPITGQTYSRKQDYDVLCLLAGVALTINKFAFDLRILQSPAIGELSEPFGRDQVGSSAMPFKRNPIQSEKMNSLSRSLAQMPVIAWQNAAQSLLERTLDDNANRRSLLPEAFLTCDELLITGIRIVKDLQIDQNAIHRNLQRYAPFAGTERLLMALTKAGADRQEMHHHLREHSLIAWNEIQQDRPNPLIDLAVMDELISRFLPAQNIRALFNIEAYLGNAPTRARQLAQEIAQFIAK